MRTVRMCMLDAYIIFYLAFVPVTEKVLYTYDAVKVYRKRKVSEGAKKKIRPLQGRLAFKKLTVDGTKRKN